MPKLTRVVTALLIALLGYTYRAIQPPPPNICGSLGGPPITSPRIQLSDGRHLAYREAGIPKEKANHKIIVVHAFDNTKDTLLPASQELVDELGIYFLSFDRAGYGESDPNPKRSVKSEALDIEELADQLLGVGFKFYLIGISMGAYPVWSSLNYIPHRLAGAALVVPAVNYWWPSVPADLMAKAYQRLLPQDRRSFWIAHHTPSLVYGFMTQKWLPPVSAIAGNPDILTQQDMEVIQKRAELEKQTGFQNKARQQGVFESLHRDIIVLFSNWEFDPLNLSNPFPQKEGSVHIWQGYKDRIIPVELQRYVAEKITWIQYHENPDGGHMFLFVDDWCDKILKALLLGAKPSAT